MKRAGKIVAKKTKAAARSRRNHQQIVQAQQRVVAAFMQRTADALHDMSNRLDSALLSHRERLDRLTQELEVRKPEASLAYAVEKMIKQMADVQKRQDHHIDAVGGLVRKLEAQYYPLRQEFDRLVAECLEERGKDRLSRMSESPPNGGHKGATTDGK